MKRGSPWLAPALLPVPLPRRFLPGASSGGSVAPLVTAVTRAEGRERVAAGARWLDVRDAGAAWTLSEEALIASDGARLERVPGHVAFWFGWYGFYPHTELFDG